MKVKSLLVFIMLALLAGCSDKCKTESKREIFAMDTYMTITAYGENSELAVAAAEKEIMRLDEMLSTGKNTSEIAKLNETKSARMTPEIATMINESMKIYKDTDGAFDITLYPISRLWGFAGNNPVRPDDATIKEVLKHCGMDKLNISAGGSYIEMDAQTMIDLGGIAKGFASDRIMEIFEEYSCVSGIVSLGGNVQTYSTKLDGKDWKIGIKNPDISNDEYLGVVSTSDKAVVTSATYERNFVDENGHLWHHIMDPKTGYSADSGIASVSVICSSGTRADALSTALFVMGKEKAVEYWKNNADIFDMVLMADDGNLIITEGIKDSFTSDLELDIIEVK